MACLCALTSALASCGSSGADGRPGRARVATDAPPPCARAVTETLAQVSRRIYASAASGEDVAEALTRVRASATLASAVNAGERAAARADLRALQLGQIARIELLVGGRVFASAGSGAALAPVRSALPGTRASVLLSVQPAHDYVAVTRQVTGAQVGLASVPGRGRASLWVGGSIHGPAPASIPDSGALAYAGESYETDSLSGEAFPDRRLRIVLLAPAASITCAVSAAQTRVATLGRVGEEIYEEERASPQVAAVLKLIERSRSFTRAVAERSAAATRRAIVGFFEEHLHVVRVRVIVDGRVLVDVGGPHVLAPVGGVLRAHGHVVGAFTMAIQDDTGYVKLARLFTGAQVLLRAGSRQLAGSLSPGPARVPGRGRVDYEGRSYATYSFGAEAFPTGRLRISLLVPSATGARAGCSSCVRSRRSR